MSSVESSRPGISWLAGYRPSAGGYDELRDPKGGVRPAWEGLMGQLASQSVGELTRRRDGARRLLREHGVTYHVYGSDQGFERPWSLDLMPFCLGATEWASLEAGLIQRTRLLNGILEDLYGPQLLLREGCVPAPLVQANPGFLRACHDVRPPGGRYLYVHAVDLARGPDGRWCVLADRTQAPSGAGYALENRIIVSRVLPEEFRECQVARLAGFFAAMRDSLRAAARSQGTPHVVLLTPGPYNETYFEHAYLARYLGFPLVEGGDLTVRDRRVFLKTLEGLRPVDVILRRSDDTFCDPLELRSDSFLGVPGLVDAARAGHVVVANALGSGLVEAPALLPFLPALARRLLGEELLLPSVPTHWGQGLGWDPGWVTAAGGGVLKRAFPSGAAPVFLAGKTAVEQAEWRERFRSAGSDFVVQQQLALSLAPAWEGDSLEARPVVLRVFVTAEGDSYRVMPGGLTRFSPSLLSPVVSAQSGGGSKDTWVLTDAPVEPVTLLKPGGQIIRLDRAPADVPSRVADNLYWVGRYAERLEHQVRILRAVVHRLGGESTHDGQAELEVLVQIMVWLGLLPDRFGGELGEEELGAAVVGLVHQTQRSGGVREILGKLRFLTSAVRDRLSNDTWRIFQRMQVDGHLAGQRPALEEVPGVLNTLIVDLAAFSGMEMENMTRGPAWRFLDIGRRIERALGLLQLWRAALAAEGDRTVVLAPLLEIADSVMTYRRRYFEQMHLGTVLDLLLVEEANPRSLAFQLESLHDHLDFLPREGAHGESPEQRELMAVFEGVHGADVLALAQAPEELDALLARLADGICRISDHLTHHYFSHATLRAS
jgi:uncharacterized circularly permuted ATP-grasp superfamily protein/uncharacterized alpha-E superfamily protein